MTKKYKNIVAALFSALMVICAWITVPTVVPFTMQTLAVFLTAQLLTLRYSLLSMGIYVGLGVAGLPVFSGFQGGIGTLLGPTGGYITGFVIIILTTAIAMKILGDGQFVRIISMTAGLVLCYVLGTAWFMIITKTNLISALIICVLPYIIFDIAKMFFACLLYKKLKKLIKEKPHFF